MASSSSTTFSEPVQLNPTGCVVKDTEGKGRGVYSSRSIPRQTVIEISPVLLFSKEEYNKYGKYTVLDHYTFKWQDGRMALALGLGSLFNHSDPPNVSYTHDQVTNTIRYITTRDIEPGEELCIFYGHNLWFQPSDELSRNKPTEEAEDGWGGLLSVDDAVEAFSSDCPYPDDDTTLVPEEALPFVRFKLPPEEEEMDSIRTVMAWVVDVPDQRQISNLLKWTRRTGIDTPDLGHLKRIRKQGDITSFLLTTSPAAPVLPEEFQLQEPYSIPVPATSALTPIQLNLKNTLWPTIFTPSRKDELEPWTWAKVRWAWNAMRTAAQAAQDAKMNNELSIAAHVPAPLETPDLFGASVFIANDTRNSTKHPLRHAVLNVARQVADHHTSTRGTTAPQGSQDSTGVDDSSPEGRGNGSNYLLTSLTLFTTHEPCIMCSMALIHSRVKEIFYLFPMPKTGGCGGVACLPTLKGVNHRFGIFTWKREYREIESLVLDESIDA